jgi:two-component system chemotaxis response regulator CheY
LSFRVLIVEHSNAAGQRLADAVRSVSGVDAWITSTGFEALKLLSRSRFDLIITSLRMPDLNGLEFVNFVKKNPCYRDVPVFIAAEEKSDGDRDRGLALGAAEYLLHPIQTPSLEALLRRYLHLQVA